MSEADSPRPLSSDVRAARLMSIVLPLSRAMFSNWAQSKMEMPELLHWLTNCWPLLTLPAIGAAVPVPPTLTVFPFAAAILAS